MCGDGLILQGVVMGNDVSGGDYLHDEDEDSARYNVDVVTCHCGQEAEGAVEEV